MKSVNLWLVASAILGLAFASCTKQAEVASSPEGALQKYVSEAFAARAQSDKQKLLDLSTGDAHAMLEAMSAEDFKRRFLDANLRLTELNMKDVRQEANGDVSLVYELSFKEGKPEAVAVHTYKKIAYLTRDEKGAWKIRATKNIKSFIEKKEDLVITPEITDKSEAPAEK
jgi:hypothetical protein